MSRYVFKKPTSEMRLLNTLQNIVPGKLESEVFESTDSEILRRDLYNEKWDSNKDDTVYSGPGCQNHECIDRNQQQPKENLRLNLIGNTGLFIQSVAMLVVW